MDELFASSIMNQPLNGASTSPMGVAMGLGMPGLYNPYMNTNYLGGITMAPGLACDVYGSVAREKEKNMSALKKTLLGIGGILLTAFTFGKFRKLGKALHKMFK